MHNLSRHAIHVLEVLTVTLETMESIQREQKEIYESLENDLGKTYCRQAQEYTSFQLQMVRSLKQRSDSNYQRLKNEITLVIKFFYNFPSCVPWSGNLRLQAFNLIAQQDNTVMKSIALLTMAFLPATFISVRHSSFHLPLVSLMQFQALFSTTFFAFDKNKIVISNKVWVYWVITVPSTLIIVIFWRFWIHGSIHRQWERILKRRAEAKSKESV